MHYFKLFLAGQPFTLHTDHGTLTWLRNFKDPERQLACWLESIQQFNFEIVHRQGRIHTNDDVLSRLPCYQCKRENHFNTVPIEEQVAPVKFLPPEQDLRGKHTEDNIIGLALRVKETESKRYERELQAMDPA